MNTGQLLLIAAFLASTSATLLSFRIVKTRVWDRKVDYALYLSVTLVTAASLYLMYSFMTDNFRLAYVYSYSCSLLPLIYKVSAFWAGNSGSLLLWAWILSAYLAIFNRVERRDKLSAFALGVSSLTLTFFLLVLNMVSNPFEQLKFTPPDGYGLNPLLQTPEMAIHPPALFLGYACTTIPFALAIAGAWLSQDWLSRSGKWIVLTWLWLTQGNFWGALWAYKCLGWGGFWAWDPVENTSLLPWLTASALMHGVIVQKVAGKMKTLNIVLAAVTFELVILGTFLTRSGLLGAISVHAWSEVQVELMAMFATALILIPAGTVLAIKKNHNITGNPGKQTSWKEMTFWFCIIALLIFAVAVLAGTVIPIGYLLATGQEFSLKESYYLSIGKPLGFLFILLIGVCVLMAWRGRLSTEKLELPAALALASFIIGDLVLGVDGGLALAVTTFALTSHLRSMRRASTGMLVTHIGLLVVFLSVVFAWTYTEQNLVVLELDKPVTAGDYTYVYKGMSISEKPIKLVHTLNIEVYKSGKLLGVADPKIEVYRMVNPQTGNPLRAARVAVLGDGLKDVYIAPNPDYVGRGFVGTSIHVNPMINMVWFGAIVMTAGGIIALSDVRKTNCCRGN